MTDGWHFWIDRGGTFTDVVACDPTGNVHSLKLLSANPEHYDDAAVEGIRPLLERRGEPTALVVTAGLRDVLRIGTQQRPDLFALDIRLPAMLYERVIEARERISANGEIVEPLDEPRLADDLERLREDGIDSVAIAFLHG